MRGGTIAMIGPGNSDGSRLYHRLIGNDYGTQMPPTGALRPEQIAIIKTWIDQGAEWPDALANETPMPPPDPKAVQMMDALRAGNRSSFRTLAAAMPCCTATSPPCVSCSTAAPTRTSATTRVQPR